MPCIDPPRRLLPRFALFTLLLCISGCAVGPDFVPPQPPRAERYTEAELPPATASSSLAQQGGAAQTFEQGSLPAEWWRLFRSPKAEALVHRSLFANPGITQATAALEKAKALWRAEAGAVWSPAVDASVSATPQQIRTASLGSPAGMPDPSPFTLYNAGINVSYTLDLFGGGRRSLEALAASISYRDYELRAARLSLAANVMAAAVRDAGTRELIALTRSMIADRKRQVATSEARLRAGGTSRLEVATRKRELAELEATLPPLERALAANRHSLAILLGYAPSEAALPEFSLADFTLPERLPLSLPGNLVRQRPDIQATEALLHKASAEVGVATANLYPRLTITGSAGYMAAHSADLFLDSSSVWSVGANLLQPLFRGGELRARKKAAEAAYDEAAAAWKERVLQGYADVADALAALESGSRTLAATSAASVEAEAVRSTVRQQYRAGGVSLLDSLDAERKYQQMRLAEVQAIMDRYTQTISLFQALGGGWE